MMPPVDIVASRMRRRANGSVFLTEMDIAEIVRDFCAVNDAVQLYDLVNEITCLAAFFNAGDGPEVARILMQRVIPAVSAKAAGLTAMMHGAKPETVKQAAAKTKPQEPRYAVSGALAEPTRITPRRHHD